MVALARHYDLAEKNMQSALPWLILSARMGDEASANVVRSYVELRKNREKNHLN